MEEVVTVTFTRTLDWLQLPRAPVKIQVTNLGIPVVDAVPVTSQGAVRHMTRPAYVAVARTISPQSVLHPLHNHEETRAEDFVAEDEVAVMCIP